MVGCLHRLGRALDQLYDTGLTTLFTHLSRQALQRLGYRPAHGHLDSSSLSVHGQYDTDTAEVHITQGYSKDHRPDLPQVVLQMICENLSGIPMHMEVLDGDNSDSSSFQQCIQSFGNQLHSEDGLRTIVADSKLYSEATLQALKESRLNWICRVPGTLTAVKELQQSLSPNDLQPLMDEGYTSACYTFDYGGVDQHWVVYHSQQAAGRAEKTLKRRVDKEAEKARKSYKKLGRQAFHCREDAHVALQQWLTQWKWHTLENVQVLHEAKHKRPGRPKAGSKAETLYFVDGKLTVDQAQWDRDIFQRSLFILATNEEINTPEEEMELLDKYKEQHSVERGFRFIKDPNIVASSFFVKKPKRVAALLFVMTCCLLVYSALEYRIRKTIKQQSKPIQDQKGRPTENPTARWVFQLFVGIHVLALPDGQQIILNLDETHRNIIDLLSYWNFYS